MGASGNQWTLAAAVLCAAMAACSGSTSSGNSGLSPTGAAHAPHLRGSALSSGGTCADCHAPSGFVVDFSQNPMVRGQGATFDPATKTCSDVYCHGSFTFGTVSGSKASPSWNAATPLTCTSCHGMPPTGHPAIAAGADAKTCSGCHGSSVKVDGTINLASGAHLNGKAETAGLGCTGCHGDANRAGNLPGTDVNLASSPPKASTNAPAYAVGAHLGHVNPAAATALMGPIACGECHVVPGDSTHATNPPAQTVVFGAFSSPGGTATWTPGTAGCAATYCHGNFTFNGVSGASATPIWTDGAALPCLSCHAMPPTGHPTYTATANPAVDCYQCHPQSVNADGTIKQGGGHLDGKPEGGGCTSCHGDPPTTGGHTRHAASGCGECHTGYTSASANAALHQNGRVDLGPSQVGYYCNGTPSIVGCTPLPPPPAQPVGPYGTCTNNCHETHTNRGWNNGN